MKKKIKELTDEEIEKLCKENDCEKCPFKLVELKFTFFYKMKDKKRTQKENYAYCIRNLSLYMNSEVEVEDND